MLARGSQSSLTLLASRNSTFKAAAAMVVQEVPAGAGRHDDRQLTRATIQRVATASLASCQEFRAAPISGRIGVDGRPVIVDADLPGRAAGRIGAGDHGRPCLGGPSAGSSRDHIASTAMAATICRVRNMISSARAGAPIASFLELQSTSVGLTDARYHCLYVMQCAALVSFARTTTPLLLEATMPVRPLVNRCERCFRSIQS